MKDKSIFILIIVGLFLLMLCVQCVSVKRYNRLEKAYQKAGYLLREYEQGYKMWQIELQDEADKKKRDSI